MAKKRGAKGIRYGQANPSVIRNIRIYNKRKPALPMTHRIAHKASITEQVTAARAAIKVFEDRLQANPDDPIAGKQAETYRNTLRELEQMLANDYADVE